MENASKAILIVGGFMISIAVISVALYFYTAAKGFANTSEDVLSSSQIQSFNRFYTAYKNADIKVIDAINILNRALEDEVEIVENNSLITRKEVTNDITGETDLIAYEVIDSSDFLKDISLYKIEYNPEGKVSKITIGD